MVGNNPGVGTGVWSKVSGSGSITNTALFNTGITGVTVGTNGVFKWTITNGVCTSESTVTLTNNVGTLTVSAAGSDIDQCDTSTFTTAGNTAGAGNTGTWTKISGSGVIVSLNSPTSSITGIAAGLRTYRPTHLPTDLPTCLPTYLRTLSLMYAPGHA